MRITAIDYIVSELKKGGCEVPKQLIESAKEQEKWMLFNLLELVMINDCVYNTHEEIREIVIRFVEDKL